MTNAQHPDLVLKVRKADERDHVRPRSLHNPRRGFRMFGYGCDFTPVQRYLGMRSARRAAKAAHQGLDQLKPRQCANARPGPCYRQPQDAYQRPRLSVYGLTLCGTALAAATRLLTQRDGKKTSNNRD